jgi:hypothetical protein
MAVYFEKGKKLEIGEGRELEDATTKECDKKKTMKIKPMRGARRVQAKEWHDFKCMAI